MTAIGLMSGTSIDGIDAALIVSNGRTVLSRNQGISIAYPEDFRNQIRSCLGKRNASGDVELRLTRFHIDAVQELLSTAGLQYRDVDIVGFHGHTICHDPANGVTVQIGQGDELARAVGIDVISDFRTQDVLSGGQGAPLAPIYHWALAADLPKPLAVLNLGGVGNITFIGADADDNSGAGLLAFDTGPGNALIDDWILGHTGRPFDEDGLIARAGAPDTDIVNKFLELPYFRQPPPKSLDRLEFDVRSAAHLDLAAGAATFTQLTVETVLKAREYMPENPQCWVLCGGGRHNSYLVERLRCGLGKNMVKTADEIGWNGDLVEAEAFAFMAIRQLKQLPICFPTTTGAPAPSTGGTLHAITG